MKLCYILPFLCVCELYGCTPAPLLQSPKVVGTVVEAKTQHPISRAYVVITADHGGSQKDVLSTGYTDFEGHYKLAAKYQLGFKMIGPADPPLRMVDIEINKAGYKPFESRMSLIESKAFVDVSLERIY